MKDFYINVVRQSSHLLKGQDQVPLEDLDDDLELVEEPVVWLKIPGRTQFYHFGLHLEEGKVTFLHTTHVKKSEFEQPEDHSQHTASDDETQTELGGPHESLGGEETFGQDVVPDQFDKDHFSSEELGAIGSVTHALQKNDIQAVIAMARDQALKDGMDKKGYINLLNVLLQASFPATPHKSSFDDI